MTQDEKKRKVARAAIELVRDQLTTDIVLGVGTGSTTNQFIAELSRTPVRQAIASSCATAQLLQQMKIRVVELNDTDSVPIYVDGADEVTTQRVLVKGGGGALTREKIIAAAAERFVCIVDDSKLCDQLGGYPLPIEVIPMAMRFVSSTLEELGAQAKLRHGFVTDNGNWILDVHELDLQAPATLEMQLNQIPGIVTVGLFAARRADVLLVAAENGVKQYE